MDPVSGSETKIQIVEFSEDKPVVNTESLESFAKTQIAKGFGDHPASFLGFIGAPGSGKSFMASFVHKHLIHLSSQESSIANSLSAIPHELKFSSGENSTCGITIFEEPVLVKTLQHTSVLVWILEFTCHTDDANLNSALLNLATKTSSRLIELVSDEESILITPKIFSNDRLSSFECLCKSVLYLHKTRGDVATSLDLKFELGIPTDIAPINLPKEGENLVNLDDNAIHSLEMSIAEIVNKNGISQLAHFTLGSILSQLTNCCKILTSQIQEKINSSEFSQNVGFDEGCEEDENEFIKTSFEFYKKIMEFKLIEKSQHISAGQLKKIHVELSLEIKKALENILEKNDDTTGFQTQLQTIIELQFEQYKDSNLRNLKKKSRQVEDIIQQLKVSYIKKITEGRSSSKDTIPENPEDQLEATLRMELWRKVGESEPHKIHWDCLSYQLNLGKTCPTEMRSYLGFQLNYGSIAMGVWKDDDCLQVKNEHGELKTPSVVGLTKARTLVYGSQVERAEKKANLIGKYHIGEHFEPRGEIKEYIRKYKLPLKHQVRQVSISFFLGFLLKKLKTSAERQLRTRMDGCVVTVPYYYASYQRLEITYAAIAAGFEKANVKILSDSSMAAFDFASASPQMSGSSHRFIRVLSENNGNLYAAIYKFDRSKTALKMMEHIRWHPSRTWNISTGKDFTDEEKARILCEDLREKYDKKYFEEMNDYVVVHCESLWWELILSSACEEMGTMGVTGFPLLGIIRLFTNFEDQIQDVIPHQVVSTSINISCERVNPKRFRMEVDTEETQFFQRLLEKTLYPIGTLRLNNFLPEARYSVSFSVTSDGIVILEKVIRNRGNLKPTIELLQGESDYVWVASYKALEKEIPEVAPLVQQLFIKSIEEVKRREEKLKEKIDAEKKAKQEKIIRTREKLVERCEEMRMMLKTNQIKLSDLIRTLIGNVIRESELFAKRTNPSLEAVEVQLVSLNKYYEKYFGRT